MAGLGVSAGYPGARRGFEREGAAPATTPNPFGARGVRVNEHRARGPFRPGWLGRFRERLGGTVSGQRGQDASARRGVPGAGTLMPHRVAIYRKAAFWAPELHYKRSEYLVSPPYLPGTAIPFTLFHPVYIPGLQGWRDTLPTNYFWGWARNTNFECWDMLGRIVRAAITARGRQQNVWKPVMRAPQGPGTGRVWQQPRPYYVPSIINPRGPDGGDRR